MATWRELLSAMRRSSSATTISRVLGLVRDRMLVAWLPSAQADAFFAALTLPSTFRQLFAEGTLSSALIPILTRTRSEDGERAMREAAWAILRGLVLAVGLVCVMAILFAPIYAPYVLPGWESQKLADTSGLLQLMFPFLLLVSIAAWCMGVLNIHNIYFVPAVSPALFNTVVIAVLYCGVRLTVSGPAGTSALLNWAAAGVLLGGCFQLGIHYFPIRSIGFLPRLKGPVLHPRTIQFLRAAAPAVLGLAIYQLNIIVNRLFFGSFLVEGSLTGLTNAYRLVQFPQGVLGVAVAAAAFPRVAASVEAGRIEETSQTVRRSLELLCVLLFPAAVGLALVARDLGGAIFSTGEFAKSDGLRLLVPALHAYCAGLVAFSATRIAVQLSYAYHDFMTPVRVAAGTFIVNISACALGVFVLDLGTMGLAGATSVASWCQLLVLLYVQRGRLSGFHPGHLVLVLFRVSLASTLMGLAVWWILQTMPPGVDTPSRLGRLASGVTVGVLAYAGLGWLLFRQDLLAALRPRKPSKTA